MSIELIIAAAAFTFSGLALLIVVLVESDRFVKSREMIRALQELERQVEAAFGDPAGRRQD